MYWFAPDAANWTVARLIDGALAGQQMPVWAPLIGLVLAVAGAVVLAVMAVRAVGRRRAERDQPEPESLVKAQPWLAEEGAEVPQHRYRGRRRRARRRHPVPAHPPRPEVAAPQVIPRVSDDIDSTAVLVRPRGRGNAR